MSGVSSTNEFTCAAGRVIITPDQSLPLAGYAGRHGLSRGVHSDLEVNVLALRSAAGRLAVLISIDALFVGAPLSRAIEAFLAERYAVSPADVIVIASHTHFAPSLEPAKPLLGKCDPGHLQKVIASTLHLLDEVLGARCTAVSVAKGTAESDAAVNRRYPWPWPRLAGSQVVWGEPVLAPNPDGPSDPRIALWMLTRADGTYVAALWRYTCHPVGYPEWLQVSSDYVGRVRTALRENFGRDLPVLFLQGFAGDQFPRIRRHRTLKQRLATVLLGPVQGLSYLDDWSEWANALASSVCDAAARRAAPVQLVGDLSSVRYDLPLASVVSDADAGRSIPFQRMRIGSVWDLVSVGAEPLVGLGAHLPSKGCVGVGYLSDVFGYWPTERQRLEGGYEVKGFLAPFGLTGILRPNLDGVFVQAMQMLQQMS